MWFLLGLIFTPEIEWVLKLIELLKKCFRHRNNLELISIGILRVLD